MDGFACSSILMIEPSGRWACRHAQSGVDPDNQKIRTREAIESLRSPARQVGVSLSSLESIRSDVDVRSPPLRLAPFLGPSLFGHTRSKIVDLPHPPEPPSAYASTGRFRSIRSQFRRAREGGVGGRRH